MEGPPGNPCIEEESLRSENTRNGGVTGIKGRGLEEQGQDMHLAIVIK